MEVFQGLEFEPNAEIAASGAYTLRLGEKIAIYGLTLFSIIKVLYDPQFLFLGCLNCFIHIV
jgi:hypothetical protein